MAERERETEDARSNELLTSTVAALAFSSATALTTFRPVRDLEEQRSASTTTVSSSIDGPVRCLFSAAHIHIMSNNNNKRSCCCCAAWVLVAATLVAVAAAVAAWQLVLSEDRKQQARAVLPGGDLLPGGDNDVFDRDGSGDNGSGGSGGSSAAAPPFDFYSFCPDDSSTTAACCNGLESNCDKRLDEITFAGVHNAHATYEDGFVITGNHEDSLEKALDAGYRALNVDIGNCGNGELYLVHGSCLPFAGSRDPSEAFGNVRRWLDDNPREVLLLTVQIVDPDDDQGVEPVTDLDGIDAVLQSSGLKDYMYQYQPDQQDGWPTLADLIDADKRVVFFYYNGPSCDELGGCPTGFNEWFRYAVETPFQFQSVGEIDDASASCSVDRGGGGLQDFYALNVFVSDPLPSETSAQALNTKDYLQNHIQRCSELADDVNVFWVDFWGTGDAVEVAQLRNNNNGGGNDNSNR